MLITGETWYGNSILYLYLLHLKYNATVFYFTFKNKINILSFKKLLRHYNVLPILRTAPHPHPWGDAMSQVRILNALLSNGISLCTPYSQMGFF